MPLGKVAAHSTNLSEKQRRFSEINNNFESGRLRFSGVIATFPCS
jgi:hypothetical protein